MQQIISVHPLMKHKTETAIGQNEQAGLVFKFALQVSNVIATNHTGKRQLYKLKETVGGKQSAACDTLGLPLMYGSSESWVELSSFS